MSYQIIFMKFKDEEPIDFESKKIREVFKKYGIGEFGSPIYAELRDGLSLDMETNSLNDDSSIDFSIEFRFVSEVLFELIFDLIKAEEITALVVDNPTVPLVHYNSCIAHIPSSILEEHNTIICSNSNDAAKAILPGFTSWHEWAF